MAWNDGPATGDWGAGNDANTGAVVIIDNSGFSVDIDGHNDEFSGGDGGDRACYNCGETG